ncbi:MAG: CBS domain-containing protein [Dehalococcoidia bacterium]
MKLQQVLAPKGREIFTLSPSAPVSEAIGILAENNIGAIVAIDATGAPEGILSERDIIRAAATGTMPYESAVADLMTREIITGSPDDDLEPVLRIMTARHFRHLPVVEEGRLIGMLTLSDLVKAQMQWLQGAVENLETQLLQS